MNAVKESPEKTMLEQIADHLLAAQREIDEFVIQIALGKAEAKEEFERVKKEFRMKVHEFKVLLSDFPEQAMSQELKQRMDELEVQLALGKADTKEQFDEQKKKLVRIISSIEAAVKSWFGQLESSPAFGHEIEIFKLKLEILRLRFNIRKFEIKDEFKEQMAKARREIEKVKIGAKNKFAGSKRKYQDFADEISLSYSHLKKAVNKL